MKHFREHILLVLLGLFLVQFAALLTFTKGFITTRVELPHKSHCDDFSSRQSHSGRFGTQQHEQAPHLAEDAACWSTYPAFQPSHQVKKVVLMIVDALRADFFYVPDDSSAAAPILRQYNLHMPRLHLLLQQAGSSSFVSPFIADTPTITMSRLKALLTGSLPTFLDVGSSFSAAALTEDNLLEQMKKKGKRMVFTGDDTWMQLAPEGIFDAAHPYPSFNVHDLHTVDNGVWQHLNHYLARPEGWDLLVGHYLGLDHAGHSRGVASSGMAQKLAQMDKEVEEVARRLYSEAYPGGPHEHTLLVVLGDHGQTLGGDHGGSSAEETDSLIAVVNVGKWRRQQQDPPKQQQQQHSRPPGAWPQPGGLAAATPPQANDSIPQPRMPPRGTHNGTMSQLDFAATLALLLGLPVPFGNVGTVDARMWAAAWEGPVKGRSWGQASGLGGGERREGPGGRGEEALRTRSGSGCVRACVDGGSDDLGDLGACAAEWVDGAGDAGKVGEVRKVRDRRGCTHARGKGSCAALGAEAGGCRREGCAASGAADAGLGWEAGAEGHAMSPDHSWQHSYLEALTLTSMQVHRYLETYTKASRLSPRELEACDRLHKQALAAYQAYLVRLQHLRVHSELSCHSEGGAGQQAQQGQQQPIQRQEFEEGGSEKQDDAALLRTNQAASGAQGHGSAATGCVALAALHAEALGSLRAFQHAAAELARAKFAGSSIPAMACGCLLMLASFLLHLLVLARVSSRAALGMAVAPPASDPATLAASLGTLGRLIITHPGTVLVPVGVVTFQAVSLFGLNWMMGEGRVLCSLLVLLQALLTALAARSAISGHQKKGQQPSNQDGHVQQPQRQSSRLPTGRLCSALGPILVGCLAVGASVGMAWVGLIDRWGHDPHDKAQVSSSLEDLLGGDGAGAGGGQERGPDVLDTSEVDSSHHNHTNATSMGDLARADSDGDSGGGGRGAVLGAAALLSASVHTVGPLLLLPWLVWWALHWVSASLSQMMSGRGGCDSSMAGAACGAGLGQRGQDNSSAAAAMAVAAAAAAAAAAEVAGDGSLHAQPKASPLKHSLQQQRHHYQGQDLRQGWPELQHRAAAAAAAAAALCSAQAACCALWWLCQVAGLQGATLLAVARTSVVWLHACVVHTVPNWLAGLAQEARAAPSSPNPHHPLLGPLQADGPLLVSRPAMLPSRLSCSGWAVALGAAGLAAAPWAAAASSCVFQLSCARALQRQQQRRRQGMAQACGPQHLPLTKAFAAGGLPRLAAASTLATAVAVILAPAAAPLRALLWAPACAMQGATRAMLGTSSVPLPAAGALALGLLTGACRHAWVLLRTHVSSVPVRLSLPRAVYATAVVTVAGVAVAQLRLLLAARCGSGEGRAGVPSGEDVRGAGRCGEACTSASHDSRGGQQQQACSPACVPQEGVAQKRAPQVEVAAAAEDVGEEEVDGGYRGEDCSRAVLPITTLHAMREDEEEAEAEAGEACELSGRFAALQSLIAVLVAPVLLLLGSKGPLVVSAACVALASLMALLRWACAGAGTQLEAPPAVPACHGSSSPCPRGKKLPGSFANVQPAVRVGTGSKGAASLSRGDPRGGGVLTSEGSGPGGTGGGDVITPGCSHGGGVEGKGAAGCVAAGTDCKVDGHEGPLTLQHVHGAGRAVGADARQQHAQLPCADQLPQLQLQREQHVHPLHTDFQQQQQQQQEQLAAQALPHVIGGACALHVLGAAAFFASGHFCEFTGLQYASPFIGFDEMDWRFSPTLLVLNTFGLQLLMALCVGLLPVVVTSGLQAAGSPATVVIQRASATIESPGRTSDRTGITGVHTHLLDSLDSKPQAPLGDQPPPGVRAFSTAPALRPSQFRQLVHVGLVTQLCLRAMVSLIVVLCASVLHGHILVWAIIAPRFVFEICMAATAAAAALIVGLIIS